MDHEVTAMNAGPGPYRRKILRLYMAMKMLGADRNETGTINNYNRYICSVEPKKKNCYFTCIDNIKASLIDVNA